MAESYHSFRQDEGVAGTLHNVVDFLKKPTKDWSTIPEVMSLVRLFWLCQQQMPALNVPSVTEKGELLSLYNHVEPLPQLSYDMHSS